jgi:hypothetical protein
LAKLNQQVMTYETMEHFIKRNAFLNLRRIEQKANSQDTLNLKRIKALHEQTLFMLKVLGFAEHYVYNNIGGQFDEKQYAIKKPLEIQQVENYLIGKDKSGKGYELEKKLDEYVNFININFKDVFPKGMTKITFVDSKNPLFKNHADLQKLDFVESHFKNTPAVAALLQISTLEGQVVIYESLVLDALEKAPALP